jgi:hypothetical protein
MRSRRSYFSPGWVVVILVAQIIPLVLFPRETFSPNTQEWWLPVLLVVMVLIGDVEIIFRRSDKSWPWSLISFAHGFNIISRMMMIWPRITVTVNGQTAFNATYVLLSVTAMILSGLILWYTEKAEVRTTLIRQEA